MEKERKLEIGGIYKHFKNKYYKVLGTAQHTETGEKLVIYMALYDDFKTYARPYEMFLSPVDKEKYPDVEQYWRLEFIRMGE